MLLFSTTFLLAATCLLVQPGALSETVTTCDGDFIHRLSCDTGVISVETALYGRADPAACTEGRPPQDTTDTTCPMVSVADVIKNRCEGKRVCELNANTFPALNPCTGGSGYLQTKYTCLPAIYQVTCEHSFAHLGCDQDQVIKIYGAHYGRYDHNTCSYQRPPNQIQNTECARFASQVSESCDGKNSCIIRASNSVFGDPCAGTYKYLELSYVCEYPVTTAEETL